VVGAAHKKAGALWAPYQTVRELAADKANVLDNPMFTILDQPGIGRYPVSATPFQFGAFERRPPNVAPILGQHTDEILSGILGLSDREIGKLHDEKVIGGPG
jgi:2-methylfumaryl-CoA isomerase